jgi:hypothetical protein
MVKLLIISDKEHTVQWKNNLGNVCINNKSGGLSSLYAEHLCRFEAVTAASRNTTVTTFWDVTPCSVVQDL